MIDLTLSSSDDDKKKEKMMKQFFGRVRAKLTPERFKNFEERGLKNAISIFLSLVKICPGDVSFVVDVFCDIATSLQCGQFCLHTIKGPADTDKRVAPSTQIVYSFEGQNV